MIEIDARIPMIAVTCRDIPNVQNTLAVESKLKSWRRLDTEDVTYLKGDDYLHKYVNFYTVGDINGVQALDSVYNSLKNCGRVLVVINGGANDYCYDAGELETPKEVITTYLNTIVEKSKDCTSNIVEALHGLTLKEVSELCQILLYKGGVDPINEVAISDMRGGREVAAKGICKVATNYSMYHPDPALEDIDIDLALFHNQEVPHVLKAKGYLFHGQAGTGKTLISKVIATTLDVPLYRLDLGAMMNKYIGESEKHITEALSFLERVSPCVLLIDEIEKVFSGNDDTGVSSRMLSILLWWLQEHESNTLTIMTSNDISILPKELYRAGRINKVLELQGITNEEDAKKYCEEVYSSISTDSVISKKMLSRALKDVEYPCPQSRLTDRVHYLAKEEYVSRFKREYGYE